MQSKISVLQVIPQLDVSGASQGCIDIANYLLENHHDSYVVTHSGSGIKKINNHERNVIQVPVQSKNPLKIFLNIFKISKLIRKLKIDVLHVRSRAPAWSAFFASKLTGVKFVTTFHGTYNFNNFLKKFYNSIMLRTDGTIAISNFINSEISEKYLQNRTFVQVISRGVNLDFFDPQIINENDVNKIYKDYHIDNSSIKILLPGRLTGWKGHMFLLKAIKHIFEKGIYNIEIIFVGPDNNQKLKDDLIDFAKRSNFIDKLHFTGSTNEINKFYAASDIVVSASTDPEAFGRISVESQAMGKFIIASNHGGSKETILEDITGYLYDPKDFKDLSNKILKAIQKQKHKSNDVYDQCLKNVKENFTKQKMCFETIEFYKKILSK
jgi:glycosyltransferase involved in cell wall biosynthesis